MLSEVLEERQLLTAAGADYVVSGYKWTNPAHVTYSIAPDGVQWVSGTNNISSVFDARFGADAWRRELARALATWQTAANINIVPVADGRYEQNASGAWQGDGRFGDIRVGGVVMGEQKILAQSYYPPPQGSTAGGDVEVNLSMDYGIGRDYDLYSVLLHETGHSLGLGHPTNTSQVMRPVYGGIVNGLSQGDLDGIRAIYGARGVDMYEAQGYGKSKSLPIDMTKPLSTATYFTSQQASLDSIGDTQWFSFVAPSYAAGTWSVTAAASNVSMLSPKVTVYDDANRVLGTASDPSKWSDDATAWMSSIVPGKRYYAAVTGATNDVFAVGSYNLTISVSGTPTNSGGSRPTTPVVPTTPTQPTTPTWPTVPTGPIYPTTAIILPDRFESNDSPRSAVGLGRLVQTTQAGLTLTTGDVDFFTFQASAAGVYNVTAMGTVVQVLNNRGRVVAQGYGSATVSASRNASLIVRVQGYNGAAVSNYGLTIAGAPAGRTPPWWRFGRQVPARQAAPMVAAATPWHAMRNAMA